MYYVVIRGSSYRGLDFNEREMVRERLVETLAAGRIRFVQYDWIWGEDDCCLLVAGSYDRLEDARCWINAMKGLDLETSIMTSLPGDPDPGAVFGPARR